MTGWFFLTVSSTDPVSSIWWIIAAAVIGLLLGHLRGIIVLIAISTSATIFLQFSLNTVIAKQIMAIIMFFLKGHQYARLNSTCLFSFGLY